MPFLVYLKSGPEATMRLRAAIKDAIFRHHLKHDGSVPEGEKLVTSRARETAAREILWELGFQNNEIGQPGIKVVRTKINSSLSNSKYDQKPEVKEKKRQRRMSKKSTSQSSCDGAGQIEEVGVPQANSSCIEALSSTLPSSDLATEDFSIVGHGNNMEDDFNPGKPNDPSSMEVGDTVAIACKDGDNEVEYAILLEKPVLDKSSWTAKVQFYDLETEDLLLVIACFSHFSSLSDQFLQCSH